MLQQQVAVSGLCPAAKIATRGIDTRSGDTPEAPRLTPNTIPLHQNLNRAALNQKVLLITPPFTQLNTPYPATAYLKGFLNTKGIAAAQADLGIEVINTLFSNSGLQELFDYVSQSDINHSSNARRIVALKQQYLQTIDSVIEFLQEKNPMLSHFICNGNYLPEAGRFQQLADLEWAFGAMGIRDKARHLATLYLEDISDLIVEAVDPYFGFSRYAERLAQSAASFDELNTALNQADSFTDRILCRILQEKMDAEQPSLVALSVPFPGNVYGALKCGQWIKRRYPQVAVCMGGGYANTELRSLSDSRVFNYIDYITLDDGEAPLEQLLQFLAGRIPAALLKRTFYRPENDVVYENGSLLPDYKQKDVGTPDYTGLPLEKYLSVIEMANPMHRLWSDGRWNKLTLAHGCYWGKCTFCDISLDYIKIYEATTANILVDRIEELVAQTGQRGFHFVDEAAPPAMMREVALEILRRGLTIIWWTNIRFEKSFTPDLCRLLAASGCIAVSGGLEVASDRLLQLINKGVTVAQVARVAAHFTDAGIMVHAYLMYGFPSQTAQETIDSLEVVRQLFMLGVVQSGFWHQFAMTAHSPVGLHPEQFSVKRKNPGQGSFANNDLEHIDPAGNHERFSQGLRKSLYNYMHGMCFDFPLQEWFDFKVPRTRIAPNHIQTALDSYTDQELRPSTKVIWLGGQVSLQVQQRNKKGRSFQVVQLWVYQQRATVKVHLEDAIIGKWLEEVLPSLSPTASTVRNLADLNRSFMEVAGDSRLQDTVFFDELRDIGLLLL